MSLVTQLNFDILSAIYTMLDARSLLPLAITSRFVRDTIIPQFLYVRVRLKTESSARSFYHCLLSGGTAVGCVVRYFELSFLIEGWSCEEFPSLEVAGMLAEMLEQMSQLRSVKLALHGDLLSYTPRIYKALVSQTSLRDLILNYPFGHTFPPPPLPPFRDLRDLKSLRSFHAIFSPHTAVVVSSQSDFGAILLNSRNTLEELTLPRLRWGFEIPTPGLQPSHASVGGDPVSWPRVRRLSVGPLDNLDLSCTFPSARYFSARNSISSLLGESSNQPFFARLESMEGLIGDLKSALAAGAALRRIAINNLTEVDDFRDLLTPRLHSLRLNMQASFHAPSDYFDSLAEMAPSLKFLRIALWPAHYVYPRPLISAKILLQLHPNSPLNSSDSNTISMIT
ncbi:hypothetical protein BOTBODRAFT_274006 [Botryobasidium botryosum FD-172 SS1]|uniref:F-box domain-containing protein n=1 Tax=Botryobasidium botryosum (strain FD-172 SS1) TaxID=930990 RepID=A0A067MMC2_BOTB1|nr:hypothetical protein BOTBODRAFT_274006 [Botryobasidium botryosum FD-172 SS1]